MTPTLSEDEVAAICKGLKQNAAKVRFLRRLGYQVDRRPDGSPLVWRASREAKQNARSDDPRWRKAA